MMNDNLSGCQELDLIHWIVFHKNNSMKFFLKLSSIFIKTAEYISSFNNGFCIMKYL
jgi:hypothetical protein